MKTNKLEKFESKIEPETSPEQAEQAIQETVNMLMAVYERMPKDNIQPVADSFESLAEQARSGIVRQSTIIQTETNSDQNLITKNFPKKSTDIDTGNDTKIVTSNFTKDELEILEKIKNVS